MKVLFDTNVIIDLLVNRTEHYSDCRYLLNKVINEEIDGYISSKQVTDVYYILRKYIHDNRSRMETIRLICETFKILPLLPSDIKYCLNTDFDDFEDAVIEEAAKVNMISHIVTNNIKDFEKSDLVITSPAELRQLLSVGE